ncbi:MAG: DNA repair protein RecO [Candidatus Levyibacteriota bacterium]
MRNFKTEGIVIKRRNFGEADRILTVFTKRRGKIQIKALGVRKITSKRSPHVELLNYSSFSLHQGRSLPILTEAQTLEDFSQIKDSLIKVGFCYHICELIDGLCPENQENSMVFPFLLATLKRLSNQEKIVEIIHEFEINLLVHLGYYKHSALNKDFDSSAFIERVLEKKLRSKNIFPHFV